MYNIYEVMEYGPIVAKNEEFCFLVTVNGSYFNLWSEEGENMYKNIDVLKAPDDKNIDNIVFEALAWINRLIAEYHLQQAEYNYEAKNDR